MRAFALFGLFLGCPSVALAQAYKDSGAVRKPESDASSKDPSVRTAPVAGPSSLPDDPYFAAFVDEEGLHQASTQEVEDTKERWHAHRMYHPAYRRPWCDDCGWSISFQGGGFGRGRHDFEKVGNTIGPAGNPSPFGGMFVVQGGYEIHKRLRIGADFTYDASQAFGIGNDQSGTQIRQSVGYQFITGGVLAEFLMPVRDILEFSLGTSVGGGVLHITANSARVDNFGDIGTDLRALPKSDQLSITAPAFQVKPQFGVRAKFGKYGIAAFDVRVGLNVYYVARSTMRINNDLTLYGSPQVTELQPYITAGFAFGDWWRRK